MQEEAKWLFDNFLFIGYFVFSCVFSSIAITIHYRSNFEVRRRVFIIFTISFGILLSVINVTIYQDMEFFRIAYFISAAFVCSSYLAHRFRVRDITKIEM